MTATALATAPIATRKDCLCGFTMYDGEVIRSRVVRVRTDARLEGKCRCKRWVALPLVARPG
ncbi:MAG: hypothetical protein AB7Q81_24300 [Gammaproteobacteria bacterium]